MLCPIDQQPLNESSYEGMQIWTCPSCAGELIPGESLAHIVNLRETTFDDDAKRMLECCQPICGIPSLESQRTCTCPACGSDMSVINYAGDSGVFVDRCPACQTIWLDESELEKVQMLLERWQDEAPQQLQAIAGELELRRQEAASKLKGAFNGSRFSFVNAIVNRLLDAA